MQKQTGNTIADQRERLDQQSGDPMIKVDFQQVPFWQALDQVLDQTDLTVYPYVEQDAVGFENRPEGDLPRTKRQVSYSGAFRMEAMELLGKRNLRNGEDRRLQLTMEVAWEPRLDPITIQQRMSDIKALDDAGNVIELETTDSVLEPQVLPGDLTTELLIPLKLPDRGVKQIASLKGKLTAMVPGRVETFRFADLAARGVEQRKAGVAVILDQVRRNNEIWEIRVLIRFDKAGRRPGEPPRLGLQQRGLPGDQGRPADQLRRLRDHAADRAGRGHGLLLRSGERPAGTDVRLQDAFDRDAVARRVRDQEPAAAVGAVHARSAFGSIDPRGNCRGGNASALRPRHGPAYNLVRSRTISESQYERFYAPVLWLVRVCRPVDELGKKYRDFWDTD